MSECYRQRYDSHMDFLTTVEVAQRLGVSPREVRRLATTGVLTPVKIGTSWTFSDTEVYRLQRQARHPGRLWSARTAWAALELLGGASTELIDQPRRSRLLARLRALEPQQLHRLAGKRTEVHRFHASDRGLSRLSRFVSPTGISAVADQATAQRFGLAGVASEKRVDGYTHVDLTIVVEKCRLVPDAAGNATVRQLPEGLAVDHLLGTAPVVAIDLMDSDDVRERGSGRDRLKELLDGV